MALMYTQKMSHPVKMKQSIGNLLTNIIIIKHGTIFLSKSYSKDVIFHIKEHYVLLKQSSVNLSPKPLETKIRLFFLFC